MDARLLWMTIGALFLIASPIYAQNDNCIARFHPIAPIEPEINPTGREGGYWYEMTWYGETRCFLISSTAGLWLYDIEQPDSPLLLASSGGRAIRSIAVNPANLSIAFRG